MNSAEQMAAAYRLANDLNRGDIDALRRALSREYFNYAPSGDEPDANEVFYTLALGVKAAFPDLRVDLDDLSADGDRLKARLTLSGTQTGTSWGVSPTGEPLTWAAPISIRWDGERMAINWDGMTPREIIAVARAPHIVPAPQDMDKPLNYPLEMPEPFYRLIFTGQVADKPCDHLHLIQVTEPTTDVCAECVALGDVWPQLRMCLICGYVGCCDTSKNKHMKRHYEQTGHGLFRSIFRHDGWIWCYDDNAFRGKRVLEQHRH